MTWAELQASPDYQRAKELLKQLGLITTK
jgi:hypothetical protein